MANQAPGVNINISAAAAAPANPNSTSNWFVAGVAAGPAGVAVPIKSMNDFTNYFGQIVSGGLTGRYTLNAEVDSTLLYDSLDTFFREGGNSAYVSRVQPTSTGVAATSPVYVAVSQPIGAFVLNALGKGTWANSSSASAAGLIMTITGYTIGVTTVYSVTLAYNGVKLAQVSGLGTDVDVVNWVNSLPGYTAMCTAALQGGSSILPATGTSVSVYFTGGTDVSVADADTVGALAVFTNLLGPGQVSYPGNTSPTVAAYLADHALAFNRVAFLDAPNSPVAATVVTAASELQAAATDPSYAAMFAPWLVIPGMVSSNPAIPTSTVFSRTAPPCALAAALVASMDATHDANVPAAGVQYGTSAYATGLTQTYTDADRGDLNSGGVNIIRLVPNINVIALYGFQSLAFGVSWSSLANVRFRMQITRDLDVLGEAYMFQEIDGKGQLFSKFNGSIAGKLQAYYSRGSLYGTTADDAFFVNTGSSVNTPTTIAAGQLNAAVGVKMSPYAEFVTINITKYLASNSLPSQI